MKKNVLIAAIAGLFITSCGKPYTCTCVDTSPTNPQPDIVEKGKTSKKNAKTICDNASAEYEPQGYVCTLN